MFAFSLTVTIDYNEAKFILNLIRLSFHNLFEINLKEHSLSVLRVVYGHSPSHSFSEYTNRTKQWHIQIYSPSCQKNMVVYVNYTALPL